MSIARRSLQVLAFICTLVVGVAAMAAIVTQTAWFKDWLRGFIVRQAEDYVNGNLSIGRLNGNLFFGVELEDVDITVNGEKVVDVKDIGLDYNAFTLVRGDVVLDDIRVNRPVVRLQKNGDGWNVSHLFRARTPDPDEPKNRRTIEIGEIGITDGTLYVEDGAVGTSGVDIPERVEKLDASMALKSNEDELMVDIAHVSLRAAQPDFGVNAVSGVIRRTRNQIALENVAVRTEESALRVNGTIKNIEGSNKVLSVKASSEKLALDEIARIIPALRGYEMQPAFEITAVGPTDRLSVDLNAREANLGQVQGDLTVNAADERPRVAGNVTVQHLNIGPIARSTTVKSDITGQAQIDLVLPSEDEPLRGTYKVNAGRAQVVGYEVRNLVANGRIDGRTIHVNANGAAYGGRASTSGTVRTGEPLALDLKGHASNVDLRNLPANLNAPRMRSNIDADYVLTGRGREYTVDVMFDRSMVADATVDAGTTARVTFAAGAAPTYAAKGQVASLNLQEIGRGLNVTALAADRYRSRINGTFDVSGSGGGRYPFTLDATGTLVDSEMFGATFPNMDFTTSFSGGDAHVRANGRFAGLDPAVITSNEQIASKLTGTVNVDTTIRGYAEGVTVDTIDVAGQINLEPSTIADLRVDSATIDGKYAQREGNINQLTIAGPDLNLTGKGAIALNETGASNLTVHAETPELEAIGKMVGQPLKGSAIVDATVTGNGNRLQAKGMLKGSNIGHGENEALSLSSDFSLSIPNLTLADATIQSNSMATFVEVGGQRINELTADTTYSQKQLQFKAVAKQGIRELAAGGSVLFHPEHQEIHVADLALRTEKIEWRTAPGSEATVQYGRERIVVNNVRLVSGDQQVQADGVIGSPNESLRVNVQNVDVAQLDRLLLRDERIAGRLNANATISGSTSMPRVQGEFTLAPGAFRMFKFESFSGTVNYAERGVNLDVRLQQTPTAWLTAKGYAPLTLFRANPADVGPEHVAPAPGEAVDIEIASSAIDLGVVQGFTSYVTNVSGMMQANLKLTGSGYDPHVEGAVDIRGGAFALPQLGTNYTGLDTRIDLKPDVVTITEFKILDNRGFPMTVGGTLAVHERSVGAVNINITSEKFEVIDNDLADLKLNTQLRLTGELRKPRVEGSVEVENGTIHLETLIERVTTNPYAIEEASFETAGADEASKAALRDAQAEGRTEAPEEEASIFEALTLDLGLIIPSNLVLRGNDIRPANAPIEIGDMSVTVGGALQVRKEPVSPLILTGEVNTIRGSYTFQGRRFEILRDGRIRFAGTDDIDPLLDIRARRIISGVETFVRVMGTMRQPELSFSSNPPLEEADILSLIIFNQPINELGEGQQVSLAERAGALAGGYLASGLSRSIGNALELDEFEIAADGEGGGPTLSIGEQVGEKFFFRIRQGFGDAQLTELILEYQISEYLRAQGTVAETSGANQRVTFRRVERGGLDLIFFFSY